MPCLRLCPHANGRACRRTLEARQDLRPGAEPTPRIAWARVYSDSPHLPGLRVTEGPREHVHRQWSRLGTPIY